jgi:hypothetical protein
MTDASATRDAELIDDVWGAADNSRQLLSSRDTTTEGAIVLDAKLPPSK